MPPATLPCKHHTQTPRTRQMRTTPLHAAMGRRRAARMPTMATTRSHVPPRTHLAADLRGSFSMHSHQTL